MANEKNKATETPKEEKVETVQAETVPATTNKQDDGEIVMLGTEERFLSSDQIAQLLSGGEFIGQDITSIILSQKNFGEPGEAKKYVKVGEGTLKSKFANGDEIPTILLVGEDKNTYTAVSSVMVNNLKKLPDYTPVEVTFLGMNTKGKYAYADFKVTRLHLVGKKGNA